MAASATQQAVYIISVNYRCADLVQALGQAIAHQQDDDLHFVVVNNSSGDSDLSSLLALPRTVVLTAERNLGFGAGCNRGLDYVSARDPGAIVWLLNPDARMRPGAIQSIRHALDDPQTRPAVLGTRICDTSGRPWFEQGRFNPWLGSFGDGVSFETRSAVQSSRCCQAADWVSGCSLVLNLQRLWRQPRFDTNIFLYYEDADLCLRLRRQGHPAFVTQAVLVEHMVSAVTSRYPRLTRRHATFSKLYVLARHGSWLSVLLNVPFLVLHPLVQFRGWPAVLGNVEGVGLFIRFVLSRGTRQAGAEPVVSR